jgi:hypothetical protein
MSETNTGDYNTGKWNTGKWNTGYCNTGHCNTGDNNTGYCNTGSRNTGSRNTGYCNTGSRNTGSRNTGIRNTGSWNAGDYNTGYCNTHTPKVIMFNKQTDLNFGSIPFPDFFYFRLTEWINESDMTDKEKDTYPSYITTGGYLKCYDYKQAFKNSYNKASQKDKDSVKDLPNFDADIFYEISGIKVDGDNSEELTLEQVYKELGRDIKIIK